ncbi:MAG: FAD-dependent oxidoreductase [Rubrivivax sp.]|nr:FAD-dependent oxidoreductase [Rubrivivax sp.]
MRLLDAVVIGGGLAGLHAAGEIARAGLGCVCLAGASPGGLLLSIESVQDVPGHPDGIPGYDLGPMAMEAAMDAGCEVRGEQAVAIASCADATGPWTVTTEAGEVLQARALVLATGSRLRRLAVPGEHTFTGKGVSHCASCDAPLLRGQAVAVVGGGDAACQEALTLAAHGCRVLMLLRGTSWRARPAWRERVEAAPAIELLRGAQVAAIVGDDIVRGVRLEDGRSLAVAAVFVYIGLAPDLALLAAGPGQPMRLALDGSGRVPVDAGRRTALRGLYAAGTLRAGHDGQAATSIADGLAAAAAVRHDVMTGGWPTVAPAADSSLDSQVPA